MSVPEKRLLVLVTGASGTVGKEVVYQLLNEKENYDVNDVYRNSLNLTRH